MRLLKTSVFEKSDGKLTLVDERDGRLDELDHPDGVTRLGHLSDLHFGKPLEDDSSWTEEEIFERWLDRLREASIDVLCITGDIVERPGDRKWLDAANKALMDYPVPSLVIPGNHDLLSPGGTNPFEEDFGVYPRETAIGDVKFVLLDSMKGIPADERTDLERREAAKNHGAYSRGKVGLQQRMLGEGLFADVTAGSRVLLVHHHLASPPVGDMQLPNDEDPAAPHGLMGPLEDAERTLDWARDLDVDLILHGHKHRFWPPYIRRDNILILNSGSSIHGKPERKARIVDLWPDADRIDVHDLAFI